MTPQPAPTPPAAPSPGVGTPGMVETGAGPVTAGRVRVEDVADAPLTDEQVDRITAMVLAGPDHGRLDRILAEAAAALPPSDWSVASIPDGPHGDRQIARWRMWEAAHTAGHGAAVRDVWEELDRLQAVAAALEAECALLTGALTAATHAHVPAPSPADRGCWAAHPDPLLAEQDVLCGLLPDRPVHRTPARVRAELEGA